MTNKLAKLVFCLGALSSVALFLALAADTHGQTEELTPAEKADSRMAEGKRVWHEYNCNDCHTILGFGTDYGPDMTKAYQRRGGEGITAVVRDPEKFTTWRKMPRLPITDEELEDLVAFLQWASEIDTQSWPPQDQKNRPSTGRAMPPGVSPGAALFQEKGCFVCHRLDESGGLSAPDLTHLGSRMDYENIEKLLTDPQSVNPLATMPPPSLSHQERDRLAGFLARMK